MRAIAVVHAICALLLEVSTSEVDPRSMSLGSKTPYYSQELPSEESPLPPSCKSWQVESYYPIHESGMLAATGVAEMVGLGRRIRQKYAATFPSAYAKSSFTFEHTWKDRTRESATSYDVSQPIHYEVAAKGDDYELRFFDNCPAYDRHVERNQSATEQYDAFAASDSVLAALRHFQTAFNLPSLTLKDLSAVYDACAYVAVFDIAVHGISHHWCTLIPPGLLQTMEYWKELKQYYRKSHGNPLSVAIASPLLRDVVEAMVNITSRFDGVDGHFRFAHAETLLPLLSLLGFHQDQPKLVASATAPYDRLFRSAKLAPFGGNVAFVLYQCPNSTEPLVQITVNERVVATPGLGCVWTFDVSKQGLGALFVHVVNIFLSILLTQRSKAEDDQVNALPHIPSRIFAVALDLVVCMIVFLAQVKAIATWMGWSSILASGKYGDPPQFTYVKLVRRRHVPSQDGIVRCSVWLKQLVVYLVILIAMKVVVTVLVYIMYIPLATASTYLFSVFSHHRHAELVVVMIIGPCFVNVVQFWVLDNYLKHAIVIPTSPKTFARLPSTDDTIDEDRPHTPLLL
ncbi:hypothetical protein DYB38_000332 [Aphanomyces astaci]|uniref:Multiple inositol polyphosphate phosphatase 1 n=1 Tax=Aphanomyces astaci TaxID=112090 RepID=A0A397E3U6_APHAT|nr:hypothetical protein DYB38_000332 [Aphanomyces astaci]